MGSKQRDVTIGAGQWTARLVNGDEFEVRTTAADTVAFETMVRVQKRGTVADNAIDGQVFTVWRALRRIGKIPADSKYETWRESELDSLVRHDEVPTDPTDPGPPPG